MLCIALQFLRNLFALLVKCYYFKTSNPGFLLIRSLYSSFAIHAIALTKYYGILPECIKQNCRCSVFPNLRLS